MTEIGDKGKEQNATDEHEWLELFYSNLEGVSKIKRNN